MQFSEIPRQSAVAGRFYSDDNNALREEVSRYLNTRPPKKVDFRGREVLSLMLPHAGYAFSGPIAGITLGQTTLPDRVILLGPNHTGKGAPLSVWNGGSWLTPLGEVPVDRAVATSLIATEAGFCADRDAHIREHSLEVQLPFFQVMNPKVCVTPVTVGSLALDALQKAGEAMAEVVASAAEFGDKILIVVSSDMSHYLPHEKTVALDSLALATAKTLDPEALLTVVRDNNISMCGILPFILALFAVKRLGANRLRVMAYATSGQTGRAFGADMNRVVGYAGLAITR